MADSNFRGDVPCSDCGTTKNPVWYTDNVFWNAVMGERLVHNQLMGDNRGKILCINCFIIAAEEVYDCKWRLIPEWKWQLRTAVMECNKYNCRNKVVQGSSVLCPEHLGEWAAARDKKYRSYKKN